MCTAACSPPGTRSAPTWRSSRRARATWAPAPPGASPACRRARRSTRSRRWAAGRSAALRISDADPRPRHRGVSHHSLTAYGRVALRRRTWSCRRICRRTFRWSYTGSCDRCVHRTASSKSPAGDLEAALLSLPVKLSTMGRGYAEDRAYFLSAAAAGRVAAGIPGSGLGERGVGDGL